MTARNQASEHIAMVSLLGVTVKLPCVTALCYAPLRDTQQYCTVLRQPYLAVGTGGKFGVVFPSTTLDYSLSRLDFSGSIFD